MSTAEATFVGSIPEKYDAHLGPLLMEPYARDMARRLPITGMDKVLELACGTGILTKILRERLGEKTELVATDISEGMIEIAKRKEYDKHVTWQTVDATSLPFGDDTFDAVVCQYGVMFFPDKTAAMKEIYRVLRPGGRVIFNVWDKLKYNDFARVAREVIDQMFQGNPPAFYAIPFGYNDHFEIRSLLRGAGFIDVGLTTIEMKVQAKPEDAAAGFVEGNPIVDEIRALGREVSDAKGRVERALASEFGSKMAKGKSQAIVVGGRKPASGSNLAKVDESKASKSTAAKKKSAAK